MLKLFYKCYVRKNQNQYSIAPHTIQVPLLYSFSAFNVTASKLLVAIFANSLVLMRIIESEYGCEKQQKTDHWPLTTGYYQ
ncbi:MAG: hypothetical protein A3K23_03265 [Desulfobacca sp. RBG_16_58_9]|nr:MAG: hypothetical protein A3K23_03265 [Desulfobacca sp. RBG_16_58_9]